MAIICTKSSCKSCKHYKKDLDEDRMSCFLTVDTVDKIATTLNLSKLEMQTLNKSLQYQNYIDLINWFEKIEKINNSELLDDFCTIANLPHSKICDDCGRRVWLVNSLTNSCDCGAKYNLFGQRLEDDVNDPCSLYHSGKLW